MKIGYMKTTKKNTISIIMLLAAIFTACTMQVNSQNVSVNNTTVSTDNNTPVNIITIENTTDENKPVENKNVENKNVENTNTINQTNEGAGFSKEELVGGNWVLTNVESKSYNGINITKWNANESEIKGLCSWKDKIDIIHSVESGFKWQAPPKYMQPGSYLNLEAVYTNIDYSTTAPINTGIKMFIERAGADYKIIDDNAIEILKLNKDNKQYANEVKKGFFYAPKTLFDATKMCQMIVDCYVGKDHYVTIYTYTYQQ